MYVGRDFDPSDVGESERFTLDFVNDLQEGDAIVNVTWVCEVAAKSQSPDGDAGTHIDGPAEFLGTKTTQRVSGMLAGVTYLLKATATTAKPDTLILWSHVECKGPA
jgi:hypothetical protein